MHIYKEGDYVCLLDDIERGEMRVFRVSVTRYARIAHFSLVFIYDVEDNTKHHYIYHPNSLVLYRKYKIDKILNDIK
jgi:hypothetical protein